MSSLPPLERVMGLQTITMRDTLPSHGKVQGNRTWMPTFSDLIEAFSYKPGYEFTLIHPSEQMAIDDGLVFRAPEARGSSLHLKCYVPDSTRPPHELYLLQFQMYIPHYVEHHDADYQLHYISIMLEEFELHERDEWFRVNGKLVNNPHG